MKYAYLALLGVAHHVASHATFQQLWVDGVDMIRLPPHVQVPTDRCKLTLSTAPSASARRRPTAPSPVSGARISAVTLAALAVSGPSARSRQAVS